MAWQWYRGKHQPVSTDWDQPAPEQPDFRLEALYTWERRCRGYALFSEPVALEPQFTPYVPNLSLEEAGWDEVPQPRFRQSESLLALSILLPVGERVTAAQTDALYAACRGAQGPTALEIVASGKKITFQIAVPTSEAENLSGALMAIFPAARLAEGTDSLLEALKPLVEGPLGYRVVDFGLYHPVYQPLRSWDNLTTTPLHGLVGKLSSLGEEEVAGLQLLIQPARAPWGPSLAEMVGQFDASGRSAHPGTKESHIERALRYKLTAPLWVASLRVFGVTADPDGGASLGDLSEKALGLCQCVAQPWDMFDVPDSRGLLTNDLLALDDAGYPPVEHLQDVLHRRSRRTGMLLSQAELLGLWHPPTEHMTQAKLWRYDPSRRELSDELRQAPGSYLGLLAQTGVESEPDDDPVLVPWPDEFRNRHAYLLGATRMGKSTLLLNLIAQDMMAGRGLCLIDPHGDLAADLLERIPPEREADVLYLDLSDTAHPPAIGLLETKSEWEQRLLVSDLLAILHRLFRASWGDRLEHILRHALLTLLADTETHTLRDIRPLLSNKPYREQVLRRLEDGDLRAFWNSEFPSYSAATFAPIYNKLGLLMSSPTVRNIISGKQGKLHPGALIQDRRILIVNLAQSLIGEDNAHFLGALLVSKIQVAAMHNLRRGRADRAPFTLYVDEFQNFVVSSFEKILSEAGKAGLSLVMANQFLEQLGEGLQTAILSNAATLVSFRVSAQSGRRLESEFGGFYGAKALTDLERGQAIVRLGRASDSYAIGTFPPIRPELLDADPDSRDTIIERTIEEVCRPRHEVEAEFRASERDLEDLLRQAEAEKQKEKAKPSATRPSSSSPSKKEAHHSSTENASGGPKQGPPEAYDEPEIPLSVEEVAEPKANDGDFRERPFPASGSSEVKLRKARVTPKRAKARTSSKPEVDTDSAPANQPRNSDFEEASRSLEPVTTPAEEVTPPQAPAFFGLADEELDGDSERES